MRFSIVIEKANGNYSAYSPDLPGCIPTGATVEETTANMREAVQLHVESLLRHGEPVPEPQSVVTHINVPVEMPGRGRVPGQDACGFAGSINRRA